MNGKTCSTCLGESNKNAFAKELNERDCPYCNGTGYDGTDRCMPPGMYICGECNGTGRRVE